MRGSLKMIILASKSPRRRDILEMLELKYRCAPADTDETLIAGMSPADTVMLFSQRKARAVKDEAENGDVILGMDTMVCIDGVLLGKPADEADAFRMLKALSGKAHNVVTGYTVIYGDKEETGCVSTDVYFRTLSDDEINWYISTGEPMDKAGAYGIQGKGSLFVESIDGDYFSVLGFPVCRVFEVVKKLTNVK